MAAQRLGYNALRFSKIPDDMALLAFYLFLAIGVSFLCSILEAALVSITPAHIAVLNERGSRTGRPHGVIS